MERDFKAIDISSPGVKDISLQVEQGITWDFRVIVPTLTGNEKRPLILALHGASAGNPDVHKTTSCYVEPGLKQLNAFIVHPNGGTELWTEINNQKKLATLTLLAKNHWPVDDSKIAITGYSNGGNGSWFFAETQPHIFSAAIPMASSYNTLRPDSTARKIDIPLYVIHGEDDELFPLEDTQGWVNASNTAGSDIKLVIAPGLGHYTPCEYAYYLQEAALWLRDTIWK